MNISQTAFLHDFCTSKKKDFFALFVFNFCTFRFRDYNNVLYRELLEKQENLTEEQKEKLKRLSDNIVIIQNTPVIKEALDVISFFKTGRSFSDLSSDAKMEAVRMYVESNNGKSINKVNKPEQLTDEQWETIKNASPLSSSLKRDFIKGYIESIRQEKEAEKEKEKSDISIHLDQLKTELTKCAGSMY